MTSEKTASFGFEDIPAAEKAGRVAGVFSSVASRYDLMNDLMSAGVHRLWKDAFTAKLDPRRGEAVLDVGGGTGDIAFRILKAAAARVTVLDINEDMLAAGRARPEAGADGLSWLCADAEALPFPGGRFDAYSISFCIRNVTRIEAALSEARRVLKRGGRFFCLEFSKVNVPVLDAAYDFWSFNVLPALGARVAGDAESYRYLAESIRRFPAQQDFAAMIEAAGFARVSVTNLSGGIAAIHSGWVL